MAAAVLEGSPREHRDAIAARIAHAGAHVPGIFLGLRVQLQIVLEAGVNHIVLTLGSHGAALCSLSSDSRSITVHHFPALPATIQNCSGAGDCLVAGMVFALCQGKSAVAALALGMATAREAVQGKANVPSSLSAAGLERQAKLAERGRITFELPLGCCCARCGASRK